MAIENPSNTAALVDDVSATATFLPKPDHWVTEGDPVVRHLLEQSYYNENRQAPGHDDFKVALWEQLIQAAGSVLVKAVQGQGSGYPIVLMDEVDRLLDLRFADESEFREYLAGDLYTICRTVFVAGYKAGEKAAGDEPSKLIPESSVPSVLAAIAVADHDCPETPGT